MARVSGYSGNRLRTGSPENIKEISSQTNGGHYENMRDRWLWIKPLSIPGAAEAVAGVKGCQDKPALVLDGTQPHEGAATRALLSDCDFDCNGRVEGPQPQVNEDEEIRHDTRSNAY